LGQLLGVYQGEGPYLNPSLAFAEVVVVAEVEGGDDDDMEAE
jgi:hypothetical protein